MSLRSLSIVMIPFVLSANAAMLQAEATTCSQRVVGETVVCDESAQSAPMATWWANSCIGNFCRSVALDARRNNCWPDPFVKADRLAVRTPFVQMVTNGWQRENTLDNHHFVAETGKLNQAGQLKIRRILLEGLPQHRFLYVRRAGQSAETAARVDAVEQYAAQTVRGGALPPVFETDIPAAGWPSQWVDVINSKEIASTPDPRLPKAQDDEVE
ncbi:MAG: hypothetical protein JW888_05690 [Pirellulales bacterium]|nr:hypothetical protein [Pirellulales bacterium]